MVKDGKIILLEDVLVDYNLPKHKKEVTEGENDNLNGIRLNSGTFTDTITAPASMWQNFNFSDPLEDKKRVYQSLLYQYNFQSTFKGKLKLWFYKRFILGKDKPKDITFVDLVAFFDSIKNSVKNIDKKHIDEILEKYNETLKNAQDNNQIALVDKILDYVKLLQIELVLSTSKFNRYLTESDIVKFYNLASVHEKYRTRLCLTYNKNFVKIIPKEITALKNEADKLKVFDNYVILHYDYSGEAVEDTKEEKEKKKDPILFGLIKGSKNLYYIGDWIDDYCDLTLDVIIKKLGKKTVKKLTVKSINENLEKEINK